MSCQLEFKKTLVDRLVHMLSRGYVMPVVLYIKECMDRQNTDVSLLRHFVTEVRFVISSFLLLNKSVTFRTKIVLWNFYRENFLITRIL